VALEGVDEVVEGFAVGLVEAHEDLVRFQHLDPYDLFGLVLRRQVGEAFRAGNCLSCSSLEVMGVLCPVGLMTLPERRQALKGANAFDRLRGQQPENRRLNGGPCY
jgi:hypothetical protein